MKKLAGLFVMAVLALANLQAGAPAIAGEGDSGASAEAGKYVWIVDNASSSIGFRAVEEGRSFEGSFADFATMIILNPEDLSTAEIIAEIDVTSVDAGSADRNEALPIRDWFWASKFPMAHFSSADITLASDGNYHAAGELTIKGITLPAMLDFSLEIDGDRAVAEGSLSINRMDFKIGTGDYKSASWISHEVEVVMHIEADRAK
jgi:polyisoprenoid-binding protein YceI